MSLQLLSGFHTHFVRFARFRLQVPVYQILHRVHPRVPVSCPVYRAFSSLVTMSHYDNIIVGSGQGGGPLATAFAKAGKKTALIESTHIGGCCVNEGCTPTKTLIASGKVAYHARRAADYGIHMPGAKDGDISVDMIKVRQRKRDIVDSFRKGNEARLKAAGVDVLMGEASFTSPKSLLVSMNDGSKREIAADTIVINTGERPAIPDLPGLHTIPAASLLDSTSIQELDIVPEHLLVLGGGYIGLEFGQLFRRLGAEVTIIQRASQLLPREDPEVAACMLDILREDGIVVYLSTNATTVSMSSDKLPINLNIRLPSGKEEQIAGSHLLCAAGRVPNTDMLGLDTAGVKTGARSYISVNDRLQTSASGIWAIGDVKGPPAFTHISYDDFRILQTNLLNPSPAPRTISKRIVPYVCYTDPQMAHVGLHLREARALSPPRKLQTASMSMTHVARALETDESRGLMKAVVDAESGLILGFSCLGLEGGEIMSVVQMAMMGNVGWRGLEAAVWAHPTLAESLNNLWGSLQDVK